VSSCRTALTLPQVRWGVALPLAVGIGLSVACLVWAASLPQVLGLDAYWQAALRVRAGEPLYLDFGDPNATLAYRYAPWFAWLWVPLTFLPQPIVYTAWRVLLFGAVAWVVTRPQNPWVLALAGPFLAFYAWGGNVHPLVIAGLLYGVERRSGPLWIALAASLKAVPILFTLVYIGRRQWLRALATLAVTAVLIAPMALNDLSSFQGDPGPSIGLYYQVGTPAWAAVAVAAAVLVLIRPTWLMAGIAVVAALPRLLLYDFAFLLVRPDLKRTNEAQSSVAAPVSELAASER
jgi:hypothetical protein